MGFQTPMYTLNSYLKDTTQGKIQLPDFQRGYKWDDERIRQLLITILRGHPLGVVMMLETGNAKVRFKPRPVEGVSLADRTEPDKLLLDGQQRLTSLTQALTGEGVVNTKDPRGKLLERRYFVRMEIALDDPNRMDEAVVSIPADGVVRENFDRDVVMDLSTTELQREQGYFPLNLLLSDEAPSWIFGGDAGPLALPFYNEIVKPAVAYQIPAIELDSDTDKAAVATVFEKVNIGGLPLNVFELLTAVFAGDADHYERTGADFRLNDDWAETQRLWEPYPVLRKVENTDFLQAVTLLTTRERQLKSASTRKPQISAKREDVLKLDLQDYLTWRGPLREAFIWASSFLADLHIFSARDIPYPKQLVPLAAIKVVLGHDADLYAVRKRLVRWYWSGVLGELYGSTIETRFVRDIESVPAWATDESSPVPRTIQDTTFSESRLHSMRTRNSAAYKGIVALLMAHGARDWMEDKELGAVQYVDLAVDIHHIFPQRWCAENGVDNEHRESIVNKTSIGARTNRIIGGAAPSRYLSTIESKAQISGAQLDEILRTHLAGPMMMRTDDFDSFFTERRENLCQLVESAIGKSVQRDVSFGQANEDSSHFDTADLISESE